MDNNFAKDFGNVVKALDSVKNIRQSIIPPHMRKHYTDEELKRFEEGVSEFDKLDYRDKIKGAADNLEKTLNRINKTA